MPDAPDTLETPETAHCDGAREAQAAARPDRVTADSPETRQMFVRRDGRATPNRPTSVSDDHGECS